MENSDFVYDRSMDSPAKNTNPRYKFFRQLYFTAGDYEQFLERWPSVDWAPNSSLRICRDGFLPAKVQCWEDARMIPRDDGAIHVVYDTFSYLFHHMKKGIYVRIHENRLHTFLPFSKVDYKNTFSKNLQIDPAKYKSWMHFFSTVLSNDPHHNHLAFDSKKVHNDSEFWYMNNGLIRYEFPPTEADSGVNMIHDMLHTLCTERVVPDMEFFVNKRDFPLLGKEGKESYVDLCGVQDLPLEYLQQQEWMPIFSMTSSPDHMDIPIPTWEDWRRVSYHFDRRLFGKEYRTYPSIKNMREDHALSSFVQKKPSAVFRGSSTGLGHTVASNVRLRLALLSKSEPLLDVGITRWNVRPRKTRHDVFIDTIDADVMKNIGLSKYMDILEQCRNFRYVLHLPGHSFAYRLGLELASSALVILWHSDYQIWYSEMLQDKVHLCVVHTVEELLDTIQWCNNHPAECFRMIENAHEFYDKHLSREGVLNYLEGLVGDLSCRYPLFKYPKKTWFTHQNEIQEEYLAAKEEASVKNNIVFDEEAVELIKKGKQSDVYRAPLTSTKSSKQGAHREFVCFKEFKEASNGTHEAFIGQLVLNEMSRPEIMKTLGRKGNRVFLEYIHGVTLDQWISERSADPNLFQDFLIIFLHVSHVLQYLQTYARFMHYDLYPWNIIIQETRVQSYFFPDQNVCLRNKFLPRLIDYGRSAGIVDEQLFLGVQPFHMCALHDFLSLMLTGFYHLITTVTLDNHQVKQVLYILNFLKEIGYHEITFVSLHQAKHFLRVEKKFGSLLIAKKSHIQHARISDFWTYLQKKPSSSLFRECFSSSLYFQFMSPHHEVLRLGSVDRLQTAGRQRQTILIASIRERFTTKQQLSSWDDRLEQDLASLFQLEREEVRKSYLRWKRWKSLADGEDSKDEFAVLRHYFHRVLDYRNRVLLGRLRLTPPLPEPSSTPQTYDLSDMLQNLCFSTDSVLFLTRTARFPLDEKFADFIEKNKSWLEGCVTIHLQISSNASFSRQRQWIFSAKEPTQYPEFVEQEPADRNDPTPPPSLASGATWNKPLYIFKLPLPAADSTTSFSDIVNMQWKEYSTSPQKSSSSISFQFYLAYQTNLWLWPLNRSKLLKLLFSSNKQNHGKDFLV